MFVRKHFATEKCIPKECIKKKKTAKDLNTLDLQAEVFK